MKRFYTRHERIINALVLALLPITLCILRALFDHKSLFDVWFCGSNWQDELFYYQMTSGVVHHGIPQGYFGYNENCAPYLSFGTWSPALLVFWAVWGVIFGWNIFSPVICNIVFLSVALFIFGWLVRPAKKNFVFLTLLLSSLTPLSRFMLSCMPEISAISLLIVMFSLWYASDKEYKKSLMIISYVLFVLGVLMRPYIIIFIIIPAAIEYRNRKISILTPIGVSFLALILYGFVTKAFSSPYFFSAVRTQWITDIFTKGLVEGLKSLFDTICLFGSEVAKLLWPGLRYGKGGDAYYGVAFAFALLFLLLSVKDIMGRPKKTLFTVSMFVSVVGMLFAIILMYQIMEGARHLLMFIVVCCIVLSMREMDKIDVGITILTLLALVWVFVYKANDDYYYRVSYKDEGIEYVENIADQLSENMVLEEGLTWDNTVIWVSVDYIPVEDTYQETVWRMLYGLPEGFALNICTADYVNENMEFLKAGYVATVPGGTVALALEERGAKVMAQNEFFVMYDIKY